MIQGSSFFEAVLLKCPFTSDTMSRQLVIRFRRNGTM